jgi:hypothetical protein
MISITSLQRAMLVAVPAIAAFSSGLFGCKSRDTSSHVLVGRPPVETNGEFTKRNYHSRKSSMKKDDSGAERVVYEVLGVRADKSSSNSDESAMSQIILAYKKSGEQRDEAVVRKQITWFEQNGYRFLSRYKGSDDLKSTPLKVFVNKEGNLMVENYGAINVKFTSINAVESANIFLKPYNYTAKKMFDDTLFRITPIEGDNPHTLDFIDVAEKLYAMDDVFFAEPELTVYVGSPR